MSYAELPLAPGAAVLLRHTARSRRCSVCEVAGTITDDEVRHDLTRVHREVWAAIGRAGASWTGGQRIELATTAIIAISDESPTPAWVAPSSVAGALSHAELAPRAAHDIVHRIARHAGTLTAGWYRSASAAVGEMAYIELVALTSQVAAIWAFRRAAGLEQLALPTAIEGAPTEVFAPDLATASLNWVKVAAPADQRAAVVQAYTAVPDEHARTWRLADEQYIPDLDMVDPRWTRGTLSRPQMELVAATVAQLRGCFY
jgi:hypothetical protein